MTFTIVSVIKASDFADDRLYPSPTVDRRYPVRLDAADSNAASFYARSLTVTVESGGASATAYRLAEHSIRLLVTDSRIAVLCRDYDKGGGWTGTGLGVIYAGLFNSISRTAANVRSAGKVLAGQIRYQWLVEAGGSSNGRELLLRVRDGDENVTLRLILAKPHDANEVARDIVIRAAKHHIAGDQQLTDDQRQRWATLLSAQPLAATRGRISSWTAPSFYRPSETTVPYPAGSGAPAEQPQKQVEDAAPVSAVFVGQGSDVEVSDVTHVRPRTRDAAEPQPVDEAPILPAAGWFDDGYGALRWWDGQRWTDHTQPQT